MEKTRHIGGLVVSLAVAGIIAGQALKEVGNALEDSTAHIYDEPIKVISALGTIQGTTGRAGDANCFVYDGKSFVVHPDEKYSPHTHYGLRDFLQKFNPNATRTDLNVLERAFHLANSPDLQVNPQWKPGYEFKASLNSPIPGPGMYNVPWQIPPGLCAIK